MGNDLIGGARKLWKSVTAKNFGLVQVWKRPQTSCIFIFYRADKVFGILRSVIHALVSDFLNEAVLYLLFQKSSGGSGCLIIPDHRRTAAVDRTMSVQRSAHVGRAAVLRTSQQDADAVE